MIGGKTLTRVAVGLGLVGACTVVDKGEYTFTDNPDATGGEESGGGTGGAQGGTGGNSGTSGTAGEGGEVTGGSGGRGGTGGGTSGDGGGGTGGAGDGCDPNPCANDGVCTSTGGSFTCDCADGWEGETCEDDMDSCDPDPCLNGGRCTDLVAAFECTCLGPFTGLKCELPRFETITLPPRSYARAVSADGTVVLGAYSNPDGFWRPYFWSTGTMAQGVQGIPSELRMANVRPNAISGNGVHWVGESDFPATPGATSPIGGTASQAGVVNLPPDPVAYGSLLDIDANATQSVGYVNNTQPNGYRAFFWNAPGMPSPLPPPMLGGMMMMPRWWEAGAITRDARITAGSLEDFGGSWFVVHWGGAGVTLPPPVPGPAGARSIRVHGVSANGQVVVGSFDDAAIAGLAFVTQVTRFNVIAPLASGSSTAPLPSNAWDINDDGTVIAGDVEAGMAGMPGRNAVVWPNELPPMPRTVEDILRSSNVDLRGTHLSIAYGVSADGKTVVGEAFEMGGGQVGFIARLP